MPHPALDNWWHKNHLSGWKYPVLPTKKELIYRIFRAAYPHGAFVDDDLKSVELSHKENKDEIWNKLDVQITMANHQLQSFLQKLFEEESRLRSNPQKQEVLSKYYKALLSEARHALYIAQNGRYLEFRRMEELLVWYKQENSKSWMNEPEQGGPQFELPQSEDFQFAEEHLKLETGGDAAVHLHSLHVLEPEDSTSAASRLPA